MLMASNRETSIAKLNENIREFPDFPQKGVNFRDIFSLLRSPELLKLVIDLLVQDAKSLGVKIDLVVGLDSRGFLFGPPIALELGAGFVPVRKGGKLPGDTITQEFVKEYGKDVFEMQKGSILPGQNVLVLDDLIATGGSMLAACELVRTQGGTVAGCQLVVELRALKGRERVLKQFEGVPFRVLLEY